MLLKKALTHSPLLRYLTDKSNKGISPSFITLVSYFLLIFLLCLGLVSYAFEDFGSEDYNRARIIGHMMKRYFGMMHYSHKDFNDDLSSAAFKLYIKRLDPQKRFFLKNDIDKLRAYSTLIDDEISSGRIELPLVASSVFSQRAAQTQRMVNDIISSDINFLSDENIETDNDKIDFCATTDELKERWRKTLKHQVLQQYLNQMEDEARQPEVNTPVSEQKKSSPEQLLNTAREKVLKNYETLFNTLLKEREAEHYDHYFNAIANAFDPHSVYLPPMNKEDFDISMKGTLEGIGATLQEEDGQIKVVSIVTGGPAYRQGQLNPEDIILKVAEKNAEPVDISHMRLKDAIRLIRGKKGTEVRLTVRKPDGLRIVIPIERDIVQIEDTFVKSTLIKDNNNSIAFGYIKIPSFYRDFEKSRGRKENRNVTDDVRNELIKLQSRNINGLILDLRNNGGGALTDAVKVTGLFIKTGPVVQIKESEGKIKILSDTDPEVSYEGPIIVLVNTFSASAAEIVAGALQDYRRAIIIGSEHTHGKGTVQAMVDLNDSIMPLASVDKYKPLGALKITTQKFYRVTGESNQYKGIIPDIVLPDRFISLKSGEQFLDYALPWDTVTPVPYSMWSQLRVDYSKLKASSRERVSASKDLKEMETDSKRISEQQKDTMRSLNIDFALKEREKNRNSKEGRKNSHGQGNREKKNSDARLSEEKRLELWTKELREDAYVQEAIALLSDLVSSHEGLVNIEKKLPDSP